MKVTVHLDLHAIEEAAKFLEEESIAMRFGMEMPSGERALARWLRRNGLNGNDPLRDRVRQLCHIEEMARRLRRMLEPTTVLKGACRRQPPVITRTGKRKV